MSDISQTLHSQGLKEENPQIVIKQINMKQKLRFKVLILLISGNYEMTTVLHAPPENTRNYKNIDANAYNHLNCAVSLINSVKPSSFCVSPLTAPLFSLPLRSRSFVAFSSSFTIHLSSFLKILHFKNIIFSYLQQYSDPCCSLFI